MATNNVNASSSSPALGSSSMQYVDTSTPSSSSINVPSVLTTAADVGGQAAAGHVGGAVLSLVGGIVNAASGGATDMGASVADFQAENQKMLAWQLQINTISNQFQGASNVMKTDHETRMNSIRNIRA